MLLNGGGVNSMKLKVASLVVASAVLLGSSLSVVGAEPAKSAPGASIPQVNRIGIVNFRRCVEDSKMGREAQTSLETLRGQLAGQLESTEKELLEIINKFDDQDHMDSLSPEAEKQMKKRYEELAGEREGKREQFMEIMNQAQGRAMQELNSQVARAAQLIAKEKGLDLVLRDEAALYYPYTIDVTTAVVVELDKVYDQEMQNRPKEAAPAKKDAAPAKK